MIILLGGRDTGLVNHYDRRVITTWRKRALAGGALALTMLLTGCIKVDMDIELEGGAASGSMILAVSQEMLELADGDASQFFEDTDVPEGATVEPYEEEDYVGQRYTFSDVELSEFSDPEFSIAYDEAAGTYEVDGVMDFTTDDGDVPPGMDSIVESFDVTLSITFPGEVTEHNGELEGNTVTWRPQFGEATELHAVAEESSGVPGWLWLVLALLAVLLVVGVLALLLLRRSAPQASAEDTAGYAVPTGDPGGRDAAAGDTRDLSAAADDAAQTTPSSDDVTRDLSAAGQDVTKDLSDELPVRDASTPDETADGGSGENTR